MSSTTSEAPNSAVSREASTQSSSATTSQGYVLPEGKIMPNTVFVGGIGVRMDETEIRSFFARYGSVKEVKIITDRTGVSKGYGSVSFYNDVDVREIVEPQINFHGKKLKLGLAVRKQNVCTYHGQPRPLIFNPPPPPQFQSVWSSPNAETYMQPPTVMNPPLSMLWHILLIQAHQFRSSLDISCLFRTIRLIHLLTAVKLIQELTFCPMNAQFMTLLQPLEMARKRNLWPEAYRQWSLVCLTLRTD